MDHYKKVIVAIDIFSEHQKVLERAKKLANSPEDLTLIYATLPQLYFESYGYSLGTDFISDNQKNANEALVTLAQKHDIPDDQVFAPIGDPADEIHALAERLEADLIVVGTHGKSGLKLLLGSTANAVLHGAKCDVLAVKI
ncbi:MAG: universal stress protein [Paraglaciecola sp.]|uniref:universal stress protein n=1 Tax=Paraglaciecola TaxID=1621534 RepID=UPI00105C9AAC|nr:universal stress protein [Paraglaciecola marina]